MLCTGEAHEWSKWDYDDAFVNHSTQTLCDVRRHVESLLGEKKITNLEILEAIRSAGGRVTNRPESDTPDWTLVDLDKVIANLKK